MEPDSEAIGYRFRSVSDLMTTWQAGWIEDVVWWNT